MNKLIAILRIAAAVPLIAISIQHLTGAAPMLPILEGAGVPLPELNAKLAPIAELAAGASLLLGFLPRLGALLSIGTMLGALFAHVRFDWADEPPILLPIAILAVAALVLAKGAGALGLSRTGAKS